MNENRVRAGIVILLLLMPSFTLSLQAYSSTGIHRQVEIPIAGNYFLGYVDWSSDGRFIASTYGVYGKRMGGLLIVDLETGKIVLNKTYFPPIGCGCSMDFASWSPDGSILAVGIGVRYGVGGVLFYRFNKTSMNLTLLWYTRTPGPRWISWSHDGSRVAIVYDYYRTWRGATRNVQVYTVNGTLLWSKTVYYEYLWAVSWSPDDGLLAVGGRTSGWSYSIPGHYNGRIHVFNASTGRELWSKTVGAWVYGTAWLTNPTRLLVSGNTGTIKVYDVKGNLVNETGKLGLATRKIVPSPDGGKIAVGALWDTYSASGSHMGRLIVMNSSDLRVLWERRFTSIGVVDQEWSSNGSMILLGGQDGKLRIIDERGGIIGESPQLSPGLTDIAYYDNDTYIILGSNWLSSYSMSGGVEWNKTISIIGAKLQFDKKRGLIVAGGPSNDTLLLYSIDGTLKGEIPVVGGLSDFSLQEKLGLIGIATGSGDLLVVDEKGRTLVQEHVASPGVYRVKWSQALPFLAVYNDSSVMVYCFYGSSLGKIWAYSNDTIFDVSWNPVSSSITILHGNSTSRMITTFDYLFRSQWSRSVPLDSYSVEWSPKGGRIAVKGVNYLYVWDYNGTYLWKTATFDVFNRNTRSPAVIGSIAWAPSSTRIAAVTYGSSWVTVFYAGPYSSPTPVLPASNSTSSTVGGVILIPTGQKGNITGELSVASSVMLASLLSILTSYTRKRGLGEE